MSQSNDIIALLQDGAILDTSASALVLKKAFALWETTIPKDLERDDALLILGDLAEAMEEGTKKIGKSVPKLVELSRPGNTINYMLEESNQTMESVQSEIQAIKKEMAPLNENERQLESLVKEMKGLKERFDHLKRLKALANDVPGIKKQIETIENGISVAPAEIENLEKALKKKSRKLVTLRKKQVEHLKEDIQLLLTQTTSIESEFKEIASKVIEAKERYSFEKTKLDEQIKVFRLYEQADRVIVDALSDKLDTINIEQALDAIQKQLVGIDEAIKLALEANEESNKLKRISYSGS
jgi:uncharacterized protein YoxC